MIRALLVAAVLVLGVAQPADAHPSRSRTAGTVNGYPCGADLPPCWVLVRESHGNPRETDPRSSATGLWGFVRGTWAGHGGYRTARAAPAEVQNVKARMVWAHGRGCSHWRAC